MRLGLYIFAALTFAAMVGTFTYTMNPNNYVVEIIGINFNLPVAVWVISPMLFLLIFTVVHMVVYGLKGYFKLNKWHKDALTLEDALYWSIVKEPRIQKYHVAEVSSLASVLEKSNIDSFDNVEGLTPRLANVLNIVRKINGGEYVDLKENKMTRTFNEGNSILIKNRMNQLISDEKFVEDVMKSSSSYSDDVRSKALEIFARKESFFKARKYAKIFDNKNFFIMLNRVNMEDDMELTSEILDDFVATLRLSCSDFTKIANITKNNFKPDENLSLFKKYQSNNPKAESAYLYLLFEYELIDEVSSFLDEHDERDFIKARALYKLKSSNENYKIEDIVNIDKACI